MKAKIMTLAMSSLCIFNFSTSYAQGYPAQQGSQASSGYPAQQGQQVSPGYPAQQGQQVSPGYPAQQGYQVPQPEKHKHHDKNKFSFSLNVPGNNAGVVISNRGIRPNEIRWVSVRTGDRMPHHLVQSGSQPRPRATLFACRAGYNGGVHPGKLFEGRCNISWGGQEVSLSRYEVLTSTFPLHWVTTAHGRVPKGAIQGGYQHDGRLYICQADFRGGVHSGKVYGPNCLFGWGGKEIAIPVYRVLVR